MNTAVYRREDGKWVRRLTQAQCDKVAEFNRRLAVSGEGPIDLRGQCDCMEVVQPDDENADMFLINFFSMTVGILPDGSSHS